MPNESAFSRSSTPSGSEVSTPSSGPTSSRQVDSIARKHSHKRRRISRFSQDNPFFGYPIDAPPSLIELSTFSKEHRRRGVPTLKHGRRRVRDLLQTLAVLYWRRLRETFRPTSGIFVVSLVITVLVLWARRNKGNVNPFHGVLSGVAMWGAVKSSMIK